MRPRQRLDLLLSRLPHSVIHGDAVMAQHYKAWAKKAMKARLDGDVERYIGEYNAMNKEQPK